MDLDTDGLQRLLDLCAEQVETGRLPACQVALALDGVVVVRRTFGAQDDARFTVFSAEYHATSAHWVVAEVLEQVAGADFRAVARAHGIGPGDAVGLQLANGTEYVEWELRYLYEDSGISVLLVHRAFVPRAADYRWAEQAAVESLGV